MKSNKVIYFLLILICILLFSNSLKNDFIYDDIPAIIQNPMMRYPGQYIFDLPSFVNSLIYQSAGENPFLYRAANILAHGLNTVLVFMLLRLFFGMGASFLGAALFGVHPVHVEPVVWITSGNYLYWGMYILGIYILYRKATDPVFSGGKFRPLFYLGSLLIYGYSMVHHLFAFSALAPFLLIFSDLTFRKWKKCWKFWVPFLAVVAIKLILARALINERVGDVVLEVQGKESPFIIDLVYSLLLHLGFLLWPARLTLFHDPVVTNPVFTFVGTLIVAGGAVGSIYLFKKAKELFFALGLYVLFLFPTYSPIPLTSTLGERYAYFSSVGLSIFAAYFYQKYALRTRASRKVAATLGVCVLLALCVRTKVRNEDWKVESEFWRRTLQTSPLSPFAHNSMGITYQREGKINEAIAEYYKALELKPNLMPAYNNLAIIYRNMGKKDEAVAIYQKILTMNPKFLEMYNNLGALYSEMGKYAEAEKCYKQAIERDPNYGYAYFNLSRLYEQMGKKEEAKAMYERAFEVYPRLRLELGGQASDGINKEPVSPAAVHTSAGIKFIMNNQPQEATEEFKKAVELDPQNSNAYTNLGNSYNAAGKTKEALEAYNKAIDINPGNAIAHFNLCVSYCDSKQFDKAIQQCDLASSLGYKLPEEISNLLKPYRKNAELPKKAAVKPRKK